MGVFYDQPFGAKILYQGDNSLTNLNVLDNDSKQTAVDVSSDNFTGLLGVNLGANNNFKIYDRPVLQKIEGELRIRGKNPALRAVDNYTLNTAKNDAYGYMVIWLYGYMVIWLYGYMVIWLYGWSRLSQA